MLKKATRIYFDALHFDQIDQKVCHSFLWHLDSYIVSRLIRGYFSYVFKRDGKQTSKMDEKENRMPKLRMAAYVENDDQCTFHIPHV